MTSAMTSAKTKYQNEYQMNMARPRNSTETDRALTPFKAPLLDLDLDLELQILSDCRQTQRSTGPHSRRRDGAARLSDTSDNDTKSNAVVQPNDTKASQPIELPYSI